MGVFSGRFQVVVLQKICECRVPNTTGLTKAIKRLVKAVDLLRMSRVYEAKGLLHKDFFLKVAIKEGTSNVKLPKLKVINYHN
jgi:hypothetical protein